MDRFKAPDEREPQSVGECPHCKEDILEGDEIDELHDGEILHIDCTTAYLRDQHILYRGVIADRR